MKKSIVIIILLLAAALGAVWVNRTLFQNSNLATDSPNSQQPIAAPPDKLLLEDNLQESLQAVEALQQLNID